MTHLLPTTSILVVDGLKYRSDFKRPWLLKQKFLLAFILHIWNQRIILRRMVYNIMVFKARFRPQKPLKVKLSIKFQGVDFSISEKSSAANVLRQIATWNETANHIPSMINNLTSTKEITTRTYFSVRSPLFGFVLPVRIIISARGQDEAKPENETKILKFREFSLCLKSIFLTRERYSLQNSFSGILFIY